jgi:hypothetical protein
MLTGRTTRRDAMSVWTVITYAFVVGTLAVVGYGFVRMFGVGHHH